MTFNIHFRRVYPCDSGEKEFIMELEKDFLNRCNKGLNFLQSIGNVTDVTRFPTDCLIKFHTDRPEEIQEGLKFYGLYFITREIDLSLN